MSLWIIVPAAGTGRRFGGEAPKQYSLLAGTPVIVHTLKKLLATHPASIIVAVNPADQRWQALDIFTNPLIKTVSGGENRADSVYRGLQALSKRASQDDWVLVHDAARPCVTVEDMQYLLNTLKDDPVGGILAAPVGDTIKRVVNHRQIQATEDRSHLWAAFTPQMFRYGMLLSALESALAAGNNPTDEANAMEQAGHVPNVIPGRRDNIKITLPEDLVIAEAILSYQASAFQEQPSCA